MGEESREVGCRAGDLGVDGEERELNEQVL